MSAFVSSSHYYWSSTDLVVLFNLPLSLSQDKVPMVLVGNKCDLEEDREVPRSAGEQLGTHCFLVEFFLVLCRSINSEYIHRALVPVVPILPPQHRNGECLSSKCRPRIASTMRSVSLTSFVKFDARRPNQSKRRSRDACACCCEHVIAQTIDITIFVIFCCFGNCG